MTDEPIRKSTPGHGGAREGSGRKPKTYQADAYTVLAKARAKRETHRAQLAELEWRQKSGELVSAAEVERVWSAQIIVAKTALLALPAKLAPELAPITDPARIAEIIRLQIHAALTALANSVS